jgi:glutathione S-transferase
VRIFIAEKGLDIETVQIDLGAGEQFGDVFRAINPDCVVPVLQLDDGSCLSEVIAICHYLEARYPEPALLGTSDEERARILMWNCKVEQQGLWSVADAFRNSAKGLQGRALPGMVAYPQIPELAERGRGKLEQFFRRIDDLSSWIKLSVPEDAENIQRWYKAVSARPSVAA